MTKTYGNFTDFIDFSRASSGTALRKVSYGAELVTNGTFDTDTSGWSVNNANATNTVTWNSGAVDFVCDGSVSLNLTQTNVFTVGKLYQLKIDVTVNPSDVAGIKVQYTGSDSSIGVVTESGSYTFNFVAGGTALDIFRRTSGQVTDVTLDNISVKEVTFDQADGTLELFNHPAGIPRIEYDANGVVKGLLIEEQRTNLVTYSEELSNGAWTLSGTSVSLSGLSPFGIPSYFVEETGASERGIYHGHTYSAAEHTLWCIAKSGTSDYLQVRFPIVNRNAIFDLSDGSVVSVPASSTAGTRGLGNGYWLCWHTTTTTAGASSAALYTKNGDVEIVCAQLEQGSFPTSYIPTSGATATRSADIASISVDNFGYNQKAGTVVVEYSSVGSDGTDYPHAMALVGASATDTVRFGYNQSNLNQLVVSTASGGNQAVLNNGTYTPENAITMAGGFRQDDFASSLDGATIVTDTAGDMPLVIDSMTIGLWFSGNHLNGHIKSIKYLPRRLTNTQLQEQTA